MKKRLMIITGIFITLVLAACANGPLKPDPRYVFSDLEQVSSVSGFSVSGWESVDSRSLIIHTGPSQSYLLILATRLNDLNYSEDISLTSTGSRIEARFDCVRVADSSCAGSTSAFIDVIYKLPDRDSISRVKKQIRGPD